MSKTGKIIILIVIWVLLFLVLWAKNYYAINHQFNKWWMSAIDIILAAVLFKWSVKFYNNKKE